MTPLAADVTQETQQLRARLVITPAPPIAQRNPFTFGEVRRPERRAVPPPAPVPVPAAPAEAIIAWPSLVAVLTDGGVTPARSAVFGVGDAVEILKAGGTFGGFLVREVTPTGVELVHVATNTVTRLSIR
jgi:hypothetical protein